MRIPINCEENEQSTITWNYLDEEPEIRNADEYSLEGVRERGDYSIAYDVELRYQSQVYKLHHTITFGAFDFQGDVIVFNMPNGSPVVGVRAESLWFNQMFLNESDQAWLEANHPGYLLVLNNRNRYPLRDANWITGVTPINEPQLVTQNTDVTFTIYNQNEQIFTRTEFNQYPNIVTNCIPSLDKCPENTCTVDCGDHICCYNEEGISVFSYLKP